MSYYRIENLYKESISNLKISKKLLELLIEKFCVENSLQGYIDYFNLNGNEGKYAGSYDFSNKRLIINTDLIMKSSMKSLRLMPYLSEQQKFITSYNYLIQCLYHELTHVKQNKLMKDDDLVSLLLRTDCDYLDHYYDSVYTKHHDLFPTEHAAEAESYIEINKVMNLINTRCVDDNYAIQSKLRQDYRVNYLNLSKSYSPYAKLSAYILDQEHSKHRLSIKEDTHISEKKYFEKYSSLPINVRLIYGLPLTRLEYKYIDSTINKLVKRKYSNF